MSVSNPNRVSTCVGWIDAARSTRVPAAPADGEAGSSIADVNDEAPPMTLKQATGANQPLFGKDGGIGHLSFTTNDYMDTTGAITFAGAFAIALVVRCDDISAAQMWVGDSASANKIGMISSKLWLRTVNGSASHNSILWTPGNGVWGTLLYERDGANAVTLSVNGGAQQSVNTQAGNSVWSRIGRDNSTNYMEGDIAHVSFYDGALTAAQRVDINAHMRWLVHREAWPSNWEWSRW